MQITELLNFYQLVYMRTQSIFYFSNKRFVNQPRLVDANMLRIYQETDTFFLMSTKRPASFGGS
jgi:hypothetical protein